MNVPLDLFHACPNRAQLEGPPRLNGGHRTIYRSARDAAGGAASRAQDQFDEATRATAAACIEPLRQENLPPCVLALQRLVLHLQAILRDPGKRLEALEDAVSVIAGNQMTARALAHCHDWQPECEPLLEKR